MQTQQKKFKVLVAQIDSIYQKIDENINRITVSIQKYSPNDQLDLFVLPEMALTGYKFTSKEEIAPFLEVQGQGPTFNFAKQIAIKLEAYVAIGYAEKDGENLYNSACVIDRKGNLILNHRKKHLFEADKPWAQEGQTFSSVKLVNTKGQELEVGFAICMDINPWEHKDNSKFELADFCIEKQVDALVLLAAWNDHEVENSDVNGLLNFWLWRLRPMIKQKNEESKFTKNFIFVVSDRVGKEVDCYCQHNIFKGTTTYTGISCVIKVNPLEVVQVLDKRNEGYMLCNSLIG